jgi:hypothetical protein
MKATAERRPGHVEFHRVGRSDIEFWITKWLNDKACSFCRPSRGAEVVPAFRLALMTNKTNAVAGD